MRHVGDVTSAMTRGCDLKSVSRVQKRDIWLRAGLLVARADRRDHVRQWSMSSFRNPLFDSPKRFTNSPIHRVSRLAADRQPGSSSK